MQETRLPPKHKGTRGYEGGAEYAQAQHHAKMTIKKGATSHQRPPYDPEHRARQDSMADALNPHRQTSPEIERRRSQRLQKLAEEQAEADAKAVVKKAVMRKVMARRAAAKAAKKKKKRDRWKRKKPALALAESRTSSASSSGSSSFESVQEDEDTDQPAKKQRTQSVFT